VLKVAKTGAEMAKTANLNPSKPQSFPAREAGPGLPSALASFAMLSHRGRVRRVNQDACAALPEHGAFVVCDGIGGAAAGEVASRLAADAFLDWFRGTGSANGKTSSDAAGTRSQVRLQSAIKAANDAVFRYSRRAPHLSGMGTTLVAALWDVMDAGRLWLANVGDSRCYRLRSGALELLTEDHSLVQEQVRAGTLSSIQAAASPMRNIITRAIGSLIYVEADITSHATEPSDIYLLASDGLTRELQDEAIAGILTRALGAASDAPLETACHALVDAANGHGGRDNITVLLLARPWRDAHGI
jgi:PPM family protein phosphatase